MTSGTIAAPAEPASRLAGLLAWLDDASDGISPIVVKEIRQFVRGREFNYSFLASLAIGLIVAFFGSAAATAGGRSGQWVFAVLIGCLSLLGLVVVPLGAFNALRSERLEQTMDLITVTALSPRRVVLGKLLAQAVKLATLFSGVAPFVAMSFLLGGVDFVTIVTTLATAFLASMWVCAAALFVSSIPKTRAMFGLLLFAGGITMLLVFGFGRILILLLVRGLSGGMGVSFYYVGPGLGGPPEWWTFAATATLAVVSMANLVLLAENRLSSPVEDKATALRVGFLMQFLAIAGLFVAIWYFVPTPGGVAEPLGALCGLHLAVVALFTVTEDFAVSRRVSIRASAPSRWRWLQPVLRPGGGRGAAYVLLQMAILMAVAWHVNAMWSELRWIAALCGYICFFTGVPAFSLRYLRPNASSFLIRIAVLVGLGASLVLPDLVYYVFWRPETMDFAFAGRHLFNPLMTLASWNLVESRGWFEVPMLLGDVGVMSYLALVWMGRRYPIHSSAQPGDPAVEGAALPGTS